MFSLVKTLKKINAAAFRQLFFNAKTVEDALSP